jgi:HEPN domain-containing protein
MDRLSELITGWIKKGNNDLKSAKTILKYSPELTDTICFHSQQAAEKYLKVLLILTGEDEIKTHDLVYLCKIINNKFVVPKEYYEICSVLTQYAVTVRYPMVIEEPTQKDAKLSITYANKVIKWVKKEIKDHKKTLF